jgi:hypothetical protein
VRYLPDDTPLFALDALALFEREITDFYFQGAHGHIPDTGCGNGNMLIRGLALDWSTIEAIDYFGIDFSDNSADLGPIKE